MRGKSFTATAYFTRATIALQTGTITISFGCDRKPWGWGDLEGGPPVSLQVLKCQLLPRLPPASGSERTLAGLARAPALPHATLDRLLTAQGHVGPPSVWLTSGVGKGLSQPSWGSRSRRLFSPGTGGSQNLQSLDSTSLPALPQPTQLLSLLCLLYFYISTTGVQRLPRLEALCKGHHCLDGTEPWLSEARL